MEGVITVNPREKIVFCESDVYDRIAVGFENLIHKEQTEKITGSNTILKIVSIFKMSNVNI